PRDRGRGRDQRLLAHHGLQLSEDGAGGRMALRLAVLIVVVWASSAAAQDATRLAMARLRLTTDPKVPVGCTTLGTVSDNSLKDLRRKIVRLGGNTALLTFPAEDLDPFGLVYYPRIVAWFNDTEHELFRIIGYPIEQMIKNDRTTFVMGEIHFRFIGPAAYGDRIVTTITLADIGDHTLHWNCK